jgi:hypothetical protein
LVLGVDGNVAQMAFQTVVLDCHFVIERHDVLALDADVGCPWKQILMRNHLSNVEVVLNLGPVFGQIRFNGLQAVDLL